MQHYDWVSDAWTPVMSTPEVAQFANDSSSAGPVGGYGPLYAFVDEMVACRLSDAKIEAYVELWFAADALLARYRPNLLI